jgi:hypothetical protein
MSVATSPTNEQLEAMAREHVSYELTRMAYLANRDPQEGGVFAEAALEAGLVHVRVLAGFLGSSIDSRYPDQVVGAHYFEGLGDWQPALPFDESEYRQLHKRIVHLSTARLGQPATSAGFRWDQHGGRPWWAARVLRGFGVFHRSLRAVAPDRAAWFTDGFNTAKSLYAPR